MATILSIETGTEICSVALGADGELVALRENEGGREHANALGLFVDEVLREHHLDPAELDAVAVGAGPGSYTGLRIGVSLAKGICYAIDRPLIAIDSLRALANLLAEEYRAGIVPIEQPETALLVPMIDARRMEVYTRLFDLALNPLTDTRAEIITPEFLAGYAGREVLIFGNGAEKCAPLLPHARLARVASSARGMVSLAEEAFRARDFVQTAYFEPHYLKEFVATTAKRPLF